MDKLRAYKIIVSLVFLAVAFFVLMMGKSYAQSHYPIPADLPGPDQFER